MNDSHTRETILLIAIILCGCFQTAQAGNFLSKKDSLALAKELSKFASEYGNHPSRNETLEHINIKGLYPCGEGAGYAGGITSSAVDGEKCAEKIAEWLK